MGFFSKKKTSILEFLSADLKSIDIDTFEFLGYETNVSGTEFKKYKKIIPKELNLFNEMEIIVFPSGQKNVFYKGSFADINFSALKDFVNDLTSIYGKDFISSGKMDNSEIVNIKRNKYWSGRTWDNTKPVISIDAIEGNTIKLSIMGV